MKYYAFLCLSVPLALASYQDPSKTIPLKSAHSRIIGGHRADPGQFPWKAVLQISGDRSEWICGGSLISDKWVLTAASCLERAISAYITINDTSSSMSLNMITHDTFDSMSLSNNIGLAELEEPVTFDEYVSAIGLSEEPVEAGVEVTIIGPGSTSAEGSANGISYYTELVTISNEECKETFDLIRDSNGCAVSETDDKMGSCFGDIGGSVVTKADTNPLLVGVISFVSDNGCDHGDPSGFVRVANYIDWIRTNIEN
jgi:secreted trypsin-like serine protease